MSMVVIIHYRECPMSTVTSPVHPAYSTHVLPTDAAVPAASLASVSAVSWGAVFAGAAGAAALSLILLILGTGLGLAAFSPWSGFGVSATTFGVSAILWVTLTQLAASGLGGYLAGRLRTKWTGLHTDETYFRDTAHGFLAWSVATLVTAAALTGTIGTLLGQGAQVAERPVATQAVSANGYFIDSLFRADAGRTTIVVTTPAQDAEVARIMAKGLSEGALLDEDVRYLGQLVAQRTGLIQTAAERRVTETFERTKQAADKATRATAHASLWMFISLLAGAFVASWFATYGGRRRDL